ncbi:1,4-dihydroxy-6-naphtoate synthase [Novipirellula galeiformis]|uniref:1,4-dihydroxy-6-naphtoate synthase n=1 Tax=Novipirellula galeiformis TaxID=2528004 RepID=A0A5C6CE86_9BACT|nr:1,4-dihydroxy-6-naphthoate synthase [Novipirellula galeiformis]TWU22412.1 1,4-dihydroxy-6-naphtoate synthase [Novipirellula galeiformis]
MNRPIELGISTCPNDTFAFHALMNRLVDWRGLDFHVRLLDIQQLNDGLFRNEFDVAKTSFHAALLLSEETVVLPSGSAMGFGVGPLLLSSASKPTATPGDADLTTLCPGEHTTATLLLRIFYPNATHIKQVVFSEIMPMLQRGEADFGVCIHEGRFTWQDQGLGLVEDLGERWETECKAPLPLGGIVARRVLPPEVIANAQQVIHDSIEFAMANRKVALPTMRKYAQEFSDEVLMKHVDLYVNEWTRDLGDVGRHAITMLSRRAREAGIGTEKAIEIFQMPTVKR